MKNWLIKYKEGGGPCTDAKGNIIPCEEKRLSELGSDAYTAMQPFYNTVFEAADKYANPETGMVSPFNSTRARLKGIVKHPEVLFMKRHQIKDEAADPYHTGQYTIDKIGNRERYVWPNEWAEPRKERNTGNSSWWQENIKNPYQDWNDRRKINRGIRRQGQCWGANCYDENETQDQAKYGGLLSRTVTCSNCGHSWKGATGGLDPMTCHKCGGMIKMQNGGPIDDVVANEAKAKDFLKNWYKGRAELPQFKDVATGRLKTIDNLNYKFVPGAETNSDIAYFPKTGGKTVYLTDPEDPNFNANRLAILPEVIAHEYTHALDYNNPQRNRESFKSVSADVSGLDPAKYRWMTSSQPVRNIDEEGNPLSWWRVASGYTPGNKDRVRSQNNPEVAGVMNMFRMTEGIDPKQVWDEKNITPYIKKYSDKKYLDKRTKENYTPSLIQTWMNHFGNDPKSISDMLNKYVKNDNKETSNIARYGGPTWIDSYKNGGLTDDKKPKKTKTTEQKINNWLGNPMGKAERKAEEFGEKWYDPVAKKWEKEQVDNFRHPMAGRYTAEAIANKFPEFMRNYTPVPRVAGFIGANAFGIGHEVMEPNQNPNYSFWDKIREGGEDAFNNMVGAGVGSLPFVSDEQKTKMLKYLSDNNLLPDGHGKGNMYFKKHGGDISIPNLEKDSWITKYDVGGKIGDPDKPYNAKTNPQGYVSLKNNKDWFDNHASWSNTGNAKYDAKVRQQVLTGRFGVDPNTGALVKLPKSEWTNVSDAYKEEASEEWGKKSMQQRFNSKTPASTEMRKREVAKSTQETFKNPIMYAPAAVAAAPFVAGALPAIAAGVSSGLSAPLTIGSSVFPAITAGNLANLGFGMYSANQFANPNSETRESIKTAYKNPTFGNVTNAVVNTGLNTLGVVTSPGVVQGLKSGYGALKVLPSYTDKLIYPTRVYRAEAPGGNVTGYSSTGEQGKLADRVFKKGEFATKDLGESFQYLRGSEAGGGKKGLITGQDMNFTEYKVPFWKRNVSFDKDVVALKKMQGTDVNPNEYIIPNKTILDKVLYPRRTTTIQAVPQSIKDMETVLPSGVTTRFYNPGSIPLSAKSTEFASPAYKYIEDQINAVTGHRMPLTYQFDQSLGLNQNVPMLNWKQPQFAPDPGIGKFNEGFSPIKETLYKYNPWKFKPQEGTMMYRGIGEEGMKDALQSGVFRAKQLDYPEGRSLAEKVTTPKQFGRAFFSPSFSTADKYGQGYIAEVPISSAEWAKRYGNKTWSQMANRDIPIGEGKILKKDWLFGYKQVKPKSTLAQSNQSIFSRKKAVNPEDELKIVRGNYLTNELPKNYIVDKDIAKTADKQKSWLQSDEYIARRSASTGESESQIKKDVNNMLKKWEKVKIVSEKTKYANVKNAAGSYSDIENTIRINPDLKGGREDSLDVLNHEILHALSQFSTTRNYKNYPVTKIGNTLTNALNSKYNKYLSEAPEQQVRALRLLDFMENKYGIPRGQKVSTDNITKLIEDINPGGVYEKEFWNNYHDVGDQLKGMKEADQKYKFIPKNLLSLKNPIRAVNQGNLKKNIVEHLNKAYVVPAGIVGAAALQNNQEVSQQRYGGSVKNKKWINKYK